MTNIEAIEDKYKEAVQGIKEEWFQGGTNKWYNYIVSLPLEARITYLVVVLDNQVFNGGFHQYFSNTYGQFAKETIEALKIIGAFSKAKLLKEALKMVNTENYSDELFREKVHNRQIEKLFISDELIHPLYELDGLYYDCEQEDIEQLLGDYLNNHK